MKKVLDAAFGLSFSTKKFEELLYDARAEFNLTVSDFQDKISEFTSKVTNLLKDGHHKKAYLKVDIVIRKQNHLEAYNIIIGYLGLLIDDIDKIKPKRDIPEELLEAVSSLIYAAPRIQSSSPCFTALQDVRKTLLSHFGQNLAAQYLEMHTDCRINPQIIEKLSKKKSVREVRMKLLEEIAAKENIVLKLEEASTSTEGTSDKVELASEKIVEDETGKGCGLSDPVKSEKKKQTDGADTEKSGQEQEGNDDGSEHKAIDVSEEALANSSKGPGNKESEQEQKSSKDGLVKRGKKKHTNVGGKAVGSSSKGPENEKSGQEQEGNANGSAKRGNATQKGKKKQKDVAEKTLGNSSEGPENKESEQEGNDDGLAKSGKKKHTDVVAKALGSSSKSEQEGNNDVRSESERLVVSDSEDISKLDEDIVDWLEKDIDIDWSVEGSVDVDHMVHLVGETAELKRPLSVRTKRVPEQQ